MRDSNSRGVAPNTLSNNAHQRSPMAATVRDLPEHDPGRPPVNGPGRRRMRQELRQVACAVAGWAEHLRGHACRARMPLRVRQRADPALTAAQPVRVVAKYGLDR